MGLREIKKSQLKLSFLEAALELLKKEPFEKIKVLDICHRVGTSEVTFFKYFRRKEEILQFFMLVWDFKRTQRLKREGFQRGLSGLYAIFDDIAKTDNALGIMIAFVSFIASQREKPASIKLEPSDKELVVPGYIQDETEEDLDQQMARLVREAIVDGEIRDDARIDELIKVLSGIFYGVPLITHATSGDDLGGDYLSSLHFVFEAISIKRGYESED